jgi:hypothetical protein
MMSFRRLRESVSGDWLARKGQRENE